MATHLISRQERLTVTVPPQDTLVQLLWKEIRQAILAAQATPSQDLLVFDKIMEGEDTADATVFIFHRLSYDDLAKAEAAATERGLLNQRVLAYEIVARAVDGWEGLYDADSHRIPVPQGAPAEQRAVIVELMRGMPPADLFRLSQEITKAMPDDLLKNWQQQSRATSGLWSARLATSLPASAAEPTMPATE